MPSAQAWRKLTLDVRGNLLYVQDDNVALISLAKIDEGVYGVCERCENSIPVKRLDLLPFTRYCVQCQSELEKESAAL